jgi:ferritin-like metal-binding protein YciE
MNGIVAEGEETVEDFGESVAIDTGLIAAAQAGEQARYGALMRGPLGESRGLPNESLREERKAEKLLTQIGASKADKIAATKMAGRGRIMVAPSIESFGSRYPWPSDQS